MKKIIKIGNVFDGISYNISQLDILIDDILPVGIFGSLSFLLLMVFTILIFVCES